MKLERMQEIFQTILVENIRNCCGNSIEEIFEYLADIGFSKKEAFEFVDRNYVAGINWQSDDEDEEETKADEKVDTEDISIGDTDRAIIETALTQVGIPYTWEESRDEDAPAGWIDVKSFDNGQVLGNTSAEIYFTKEGKFLGIY